MLRAPGGLRDAPWSPADPEPEGFCGSLRAALGTTRVWSPEEGGEGHDEGRKPLTTTTVNGGTEGVPFRDFGISDAICSGLEAAGLFATFPIQGLTLPPAQNIIGQARTATGKTLAFGIPLLQRTEAGPTRLPRALVVVPTRELAIQVAGDLRIAAVNLATRVLT